MEKEELLFNYEAVRDFCGGFYNRIPTTDVDKRNFKLIYNLPQALSIAGKTGLEGAKDLLMECLDDPVDYRTGINIKEVIIRDLTSENKATSEELAAILDVIYIDYLPVSVAMIASGACDRFE